MGNYTPDYTVDDLPDITGDVIGTFGVESKPLAPMVILALVFSGLSGAIAGIVATWRKR